MKRTISALLILSVIILVGCQKEEPTSTVIEGTKITELRSYTEKSPNPMNIDNCKLDKSKEMLESLTHVSKNRLFYMDYLADFPMQELWKTGKARYEYKSDLSGEVQYLKDYLGLLYKNVPEIKPMDDPLTHCSAFVCHNEKKELLFCHNMDGDGGSIIAVYQRPKNGLYGFVALSNTIYNTIRFAPEFTEEGRLMDGKANLSVLLTQHMAHLGGMNDQGLCYCMLQLPPLQKPEEYDPKGTMPHITLQDKNGDGSLPQLTNSSMYYMLLTRCATVKDVEKALQEKYDFSQLNHIMNGHLLVADATGDYAVFEYWENKLYVFRPKDRLDIVPFTSQVVPYEYNSIENYYVNVEATKTYMTDNWQNGYSSKVRIGNLMGAYASKVHLVPYGAIYKQALECLQAGSFAIEKYEGATNWSCIYNPAQKTILFNMRNDMSQIYKIDFEADFQ